MSEDEKSLRIGQILVLYWLSYILVIVAIYRFVQNSSVFVAVVCSAIYLFFGILLDTIFDPPKDRSKLPENYTNY